MSIWSPSIFGNDAALRLFDETCGLLLDNVTETFDSEELLREEVEGEGTLLPSIAMLTTICEAYDDCVPMAPELAQRWKDLYLEAFDAVSSQDAATRKRLTHSYAATGTYRRYRRLRRALVIAQFDAFLKVVSQDPFDLEEDAPEEGMEVPWSQTPNSTAFVVSSSHIFSNMVSTRDDQ